MGKINISECGRETGTYPFGVEIHDGIVVAGKSSLELLLNVDNLISFNLIVPTATARKALLVLNKRGQGKIDRAVKTNFGNTITEHTTFRVSDSNTVDRTNNAKVDTAITDKPGHTFKEMPSTLGQGRCGRFKVGEIEYWQGCPIASSTDSIAIRISENVVDYEPHPPAIIQECSETICEDGHCRG